MTAATNASSSATDESKHRKPGPPQSVREVLQAVKRPKRVVVTGGMPYATGPLHLGHLAGAHVPPDILARYFGMLIGRENVLFVCGTDDHGSTSEVAAIQAGKPIREYIDAIHAQQKVTMDRYSIGLDVYTGTSRPETYPTQVAICQEIFKKLYKNGMLEKRVSRQWYDPKIERFLPDRFVRGKCPNPKCENTDAYSDICDSCGMQYHPDQLGEPRSAVSDAVPVLRETTHWWLDMWKVAEVLRVWVEGRKGTWRAPVIADVLGTILPAIRFEAAEEEKYKTFKAQLPKHRSKYAPGKRVVLQFESRAEMEVGRRMLADRGIESTLLDDWAHRSITRDVSWGIPLPGELDPEMAGKTLYVWPDSLIAPIAFTQTALRNRGQPAERWREFWQDPESRIYQFLGQDNVFFYVIMQGAMWIGSQREIDRMPVAGELQLTDVFGCFLLLVNGEKMSKSKGNGYTGDQLLGEMGFTADQIRYFLAVLSLPEKASNFDLKTLEERNRFLAGPLNAAFEKPISAVHSKFGGKVPEGRVLPEIEAETIKIAQKFTRSMERAEYATFLGALENYARLINSLFTQHKPHDDRFPLEARNNALFSAFYVLKNILIMLYPFVPSTMEKLRRSLNLPPEVFAVDELGTPIPAGHAIGEKQEFFPPV